MRTNDLILSLLLLIVGAGFIECSRQSPKSTTIEKSTDLSFDSLKVYFEKGDQIIINDWILIGPKDFFDSVSTDKEQIKGILLDIDSSITKSSKNATNRFIKIEIPDMDSLPQGTFIDAKLYQYLNPSSNSVYLVNEELITSYSEFINRIKNRKITEISTINAQSAQTIWGNHYGKNGALIIKINDQRPAQNTSHTVTTNGLVRNMILIDSAEYVVNKAPNQRFRYHSAIIKHQGIITVPCGHSAFEFKDNTSNENYMEYSVIGQDEKNRWTLIQAQDDQKEYFYLINQNLNKIDTLIGEPIIFGEKLLCLEGSYTDGTNLIEIWNASNSKLNLIMKFSLNAYGIFPDEIYLKDDMLYIKYHSNKYLKLKI